MMWKGFVSFPESPAPGGPSGGAVHFRFRVPRPWPTRKHRPSGPCNGIASCPTSAAFTVWLTQLLVVLGGSTTSHKLITIWKMTFGYLEGVESGGSKFIHHYCIWCVDRLLIAMPSDSTVLYFSIYIYVYYDPIGSTAMPVKHQFQHWRYWSSTFNIRHNKLWGSEAWAAPAWETWLPPILQSVTVGQCPETFAKLERFNAHTAVATWKLFQPPEVKQRTQHPKKEA